MEMSPQLSADLEHAVSLLGREMWMPYVLQDGKVERRVIDGREWGNRIYTVRPIALRVIVANLKVHEICGPKVYLDVKLCAGEEKRIKAMSETFYAYSGQFEKQQRHLFTTEQAALSVAAREAKNEKPIGGDQGFVDEGCFVRIVEG